MKKYTVKVLDGWMVGVHKFSSKKSALEFYDKWLVVAVNSGVINAHEKIIYEVML